MTQTRRPSNQNRPTVSRPGPRGLRFGMVAFCVIRDPDPGLNKGKAKALYSLLVSYSDVTTRNTNQGYPYRSALADALDCTKDTVDNATKYLEREIGLIRVVRRKVDGKPDENDANAYQVYDQWLIQGCSPTPDTPPQLVARYGPTIPGFDVDAWIAEHAPSFDLAGWRAAYESTVAEQEAKRTAQRHKEAKRRKARKTGGGGTDSATQEQDGTEGGSGTDSATRSGTDSATGGGTCAALSKAGGPEPSSTDDEAPSGRSPVDGRSPSTDRSSAREAEGGSAASSNHTPCPDNHHDHAHRSARKNSSSKGSQHSVRHTKAQLDLVRAVRGYYPADFLNGWTNPATGTSTEPLPNVPALSQAILDALAGDVPYSERTVEQLGARIQQRWDAHGWAGKFYAGEIRSLVAAAVDMVKPLKSTDQYGCANTRCDGGVDVDTGADCPTCPERLAARKAQRIAQRQEAPGSPQGAAEGAVGTPAAAMPTPRRSIVLHGPKSIRECAVDSCALRLPDDWDDDLCLKCRNRANRRAELLREEQEIAYEAPEPVLESVGPPPF